MEIGIVLNESKEIVCTMVPPAKTDLIVDCDEKEIILGVTKYEGGVLVNPPAEEMAKIRKAEEESEKELLYSNKVETLIGKKYSIRQELAIQRQRTEKPGEFKEYYDYVEQCKKIARQEVFGI